MCSNYELRMKYRHFVWRQDKKDGRLKSEDDSVESLTLNSSIQLVFSKERIPIDVLETKD